MGWFGYVDLKNDANLVKQCAYLKVETGDPKN